MVDSAQKVRLLHKALLIIHAFALVSPEIDEIFLNQYSDKQHDLMYLSMHSKFKVLNMKYPLYEHWL